MAMSKKEATYIRATKADDDFDVLFSCSDNTEQEAVHALHDDMRYLKEVEINFRKDDPLTCMVEMS